MHNQDSNIIYTKHRLSKFLDRKVTNQEMQRLYNSPHRTFYGWVQHESAAPGVLVAINHLINHIIDDQISDLKPLLNKMLKEGV